MYPSLARPANECAQCLGTGYHGRMLLAELVLLDEALRQAVLARADTQTLEKIAAQSGRPTIWAAAEHAVAQGLTTRQEVARVLGER